MERDHRAPTRWGETLDRLREQPLFRRPRLEPAITQGHRGARHRLGGAGPGGQRHGLAYRRPATRSSTTTGPDAATTATSTWTAGPHRTPRNLPNDATREPRSVSTADARSASPTARDALTRVDLDGQTHREQRAFGISVSGMKSRAARSTLSSRTLDGLLPDPDRSSGALADYAPNAGSCGCDDDSAEGAAVRGERAGGRLSAHAASWRRRTGVVVSRCGGRGTPGCWPSWPARGSRPPRSAPRSAG